MIAIRYSPYPIEAYTSEFMGVRMGYGSYRPLVISPAAWNLFWLSHPKVDELLTWPPDKGAEVPVYTAMAGACVAVVDRSLGGISLRTLLLERHPVWVVNALSAPGVALDTFEPYCLQGERWLGVMSIRAGQAAARLAGLTGVQAHGQEEVREQSNNIIVFRRR